MLIVSIFFLVVGLAIIGSWLYVPWGIHIEMVKENCKKWKWGSFKDFMKEFNKIEWKRDNYYPCSFFGPQNSFFSHQSQIHASIIKFNDMGMILYPWSFLRFQFFLRKDKYLGI